MFKKLLQILPAMCLAAIGVKAQCPTPAVAGPNDTVCVGATATLAATLPTGFTGTWTRPTGANPTPAVITTPTSPTTTITGLTAAGSRTFVWTITNGTCTNRDTVILSVQGLPDADAGNDITACIGGTVTLNADPLTPTTTGRWLLSDTTVATVATLTNRQSTVTGLTELGRQPLRWIVTSAVCTRSDTDLVIITVNPTPTRATAGADVSLCEGSTVQLTGSTPTVGSASWATATGGTGSVVLPANITTPVISVRGNQGGSAILVYRISTNGNNFSAAAIRSGCLSTDTVRLQVNSLNANAGPDQTFCVAGARSATLAATAAATGQTASWSLVRGTGTITTPASATSTVTAITSDTLILRWTVTGGLCRDSDDVRIITRPTPTVANAGVNITVCEDDTIRLSGSVATTGAPTWSFGPGPGNLASFIGTANNDTVNLRLTNPGQLTMIYRISTGGNSALCNSADTVIVTVQNAPEANIVGAPMNTICGNNTTVVNLQAPRLLTGETGRWSIAGGRAATFGTAIDTVTTVTGLANGTNVFVWTLLGTNGCDARDTRTFTLNAAPGAVSAGDDIRACEDDTLRLVGTTPTSGSPIWTVRQTGGITAFLPNNQSVNNDTVRVRLANPGTATFYYTVSSGTNSTACTVVDSMVVTIQDAPEANISGNANNTLCGSNTSVVNLQAGRLLTGETGRWSIAGGRAATFSAATDTVTTVTGLATGNNVFVWTLLGTNGCDARDTRTFTLNALPTVAVAGQNRGVCVNDTISLVGNQPTSGTPSWAAVSGNNLRTVLGGNNAFNNDSIRVRVTGAGAITFRYIVTSGNGNNLPLSCISSDTIVVTSTNCPPTGVFSGNASTSSMKVYPNPGNGIFTISMENANMTEAEISIVTNDGKTLYTGVWNATQGMEKQIDISSMPKGMYVLKLRKGQTMEFTKLMVQ